MNLRRRRCSIPLGAFALLWPLALFAAGTLVETKDMGWYQRLWIYFGPFGCGSILCWLVALLLVFSYRHAQAVKRTRRYTAALVLAIGAFVLSLASSARVSNMKVDYTYEEQQRRRDLKTVKEAEDLKPLAAGETPEYTRRFAEDAAEDTLDLAGQKTKEQEAEEMNIYARAARGEYEAEKRRERGGKAGSKTEAAYTGLGAMTEAEKDTKYAYHGEGKRTRQEGKTDTDFGGAATEAAEQEEEFVGQVFRAKDQQMAGRLDKWNLFAAKWILVAVIILFFWNYLAVFNSTFYSAWPLPLSGPWLDLLYPKNYSVLVDQQNRQAIAAFLRRLVRKGETFVYFGSEDPFGTAWLPRIFFNLGPFLNRIAAKFTDWLYAPAKLGAVRITWLLKYLRRHNPQWEDKAEIFVTAAYRGLKRLVGRVPFVIAFGLFLAIPVPLFFNYYDETLYWYAIGVACLVLPLLFVDTPLLDIFLRKIHYDKETQPKSSGFVYESAWFGRCCFTVTDEELAKSMLADLHDFLKGRAVPNAKALRSVNLVWDIEEPPEENLLFELSSLCRRANFRLVIITPYARTTRFPEGIFDEVQYQPIDRPPVRALVPAAAGKSVQSAAKTRTPEKPRKPISVEKRKPIVVSEKEPVVPEEKPRVVIKQRPQLFRKKKKRPRL